MIRVIGKILYLFIYIQEKWRRKRKKKVGGASRGDICIYSRRRWMLGRVRKRR